MDFLNRFLAFDIQDLLYVIITIAIAFSVHEFAHAYTAYKFGDPTAKNQGRLTLNPLHHLDPLGTFLILFFGFGWARPVPVNRFRFEKPRLHGILTTLAGPVSNLLLAIIGAFLKYSFIAFIPYSGMMDPLLHFLHYFTYLNVLLFVFNLLPLPPLDGYRIIQDVLPHSSRVKLSQYEVYGQIIFLVIIVVPGLYWLTIGPVLHGGIALFLNGINGFFESLFF